MFLFFFPSPLPLFLNINNILKKNENSSKGKAGGRSLPAVVDVMAEAREWGKDRVESQGKQVARLGKLEEQGNRLSPGASREKQPFPRSYFSPGKLIPDSWPPVASHNSSVLQCPGGAVGLWELLHQPQETNTVPRSPFSAEVPLPNQGTRKRIGATMLSLLPRRAQN